MSANGDDHALADVTNKVANVQFSEDTVKRVREFGWVSPEKYDYDALAADPRGKSSTAPEPDQLQGDVPSWAASAIKYEWSDEYGDIGPEHKVLEEMLFHDQDHVKTGDEFSK